MAKKKVFISISGKKILVGYYGGKMDIEKWYPKSKSADAHAYAARLAKRLKTGIKVVK